MMKRLNVFILTSFFILFYSINGWSKDLGGQSFADKLEFQGKAFELRGVGLEKRLFIKVFVAGFYTGDKFLTDEPLSDIPKRIEVAYLYPIPGRKLAVETRKNIILNTTPEEFEKIKSRVDFMDSLYVDLKPSDRYALSYLPGEGTYFTYNGEVMGMIEGHDFAAALFSVWIGKKPVSSFLKKNLLGL